jgi:hypothetical protein
VAYALNITVDVPSIAHEMEADEIRYRILHAVGQWRPCVITTCREYHDPDEHALTKTERRERAR